MNALKQLRKKKGVNQAEVANAIGTTQPVYANYELGKREPSFDTLKALADYFDVSVDELLGFSKQQTTNRICELRMSCGWTQGELADKLGVSVSAISAYEKGKRQPNPEKLNALADLFGVSVDAVLGREYSSQNPETKPTPMSNFVSKATVHIPIIGHVRAGCDTLAEQSVEGYMEAAPDLLKRWPDAAAIKVWGDSMEPELREGDCVIISRQAETKSGDIAVVCVNGNEGAVKRVRWDDAGLDLIPSNPAYGTQHFSSEDVERLPVVIVARVVRMIRDL